MAGKIIIYNDVNFRGASRELTDNISNLKSEGFDDRISSIKVVGSVWVGYRHSDFKGRQYILEEGEYVNSKEWQGSDNQLSSLKKLNQDIGENPHITLYQHVNHDGRAINFDQDIDNLVYYNFNNQASSLKVKCGIWILYQHVNYKGKQYIITEGSYAHWDSWRGADDQISSLRPVTEPYFPTEILGMEFDIAAGLLNSIPVALVNLNQRNNSSTDQEASWNTKRILTTTKTFQWTWNNATAVSVKATFNTSVPFIADGNITIGVSNTFAIGQNSGEQNTQSDEWSLNLPATVKANTSLRVQVNIQQGKIDVPFSARLQKGNRVWKEKGTFKGSQSYNLQVDYNETPL